MNIRNLQFIYSLTVSDTFKTAEFTIKPSPRTDTNVTLILEIPALLQLRNKFG